MMEFLMGALLLYAPFLFIFYLNFRTKSKISRSVLLIVSLWYLTTFSIILFADHDCVYKDLVYSNCSNISESLRVPLSAFTLYNMFSVVTVAPILISIAIGFEIYVRKFKLTVST